ncbi:YlzJ-like family protein [Gracilibacillus massiliensis]|uniref:YlzJ-like family protein n=1 Tax=Gracilibacillus massiliensis TaxID=1564956 RepID=UPI000A863625|nr:YlzJ-like family protein [Gracilibacillus massiliensis]
MLYTPLSYQDINGFGDEYQRYEVITYQNKQCCIERMQNGDIRLVQLLSTDPNDFLLNDFIPGTILSNQRSAQ